MGLHNCTGLPELGLVCITSSAAVRYRTITRKRLLQLEIREQEKVLRELYAENLRRLEKAIAFCVTHGIRLYRITSALLPFADEPLGQDLLAEFSPVMGQMGAASGAILGDPTHPRGIRLVLHPDQFVVLNSDRPEVIQNSVKILKTHAQILDALKLPRSPWALMNIHGGKGGQAERLINTIQELPETIRDRLTLENDEYTYNSQQILEICQKAQIPMVFDAHHHIIHEHLDSYDDPSVAESLAAAKTTWRDPSQQLVHISNGKTAFADPQHSDLITQMPQCYRQAPWIEVEAKLKEQAIEKLQQNWLPSINVGFRTSTQPTC